MDLLPLRKVVKRVIQICPKKHLGISVKGIPTGIWCQNDVVFTSMRRHHVASTLIRRHFRSKCPLGCYLQGIL